MKLTTKCMLWIATALLAAGCAGTKFVRPADSDMRLGSTTEQQVLAALGKPMQEVSGLSNGKSTRTLNYAYASFGGQAKSAGVTPVHSLSLVFHEGKLVSRSYLSNLKEDATDFDDSKVSQIQIGKTTAAQVRQLIGPASGESIFPAVKQPDGRALIYTYQEMRGFTPSTKHLVVVLDSQGIVTDVDYKNQGAWK
jgi:outer membrane protein assembly factor BamE (lipoprotein component of BamABCDE complex)